jgi:ATP-dependent Lon protease
MGMKLIIAPQDNEVDVEEIPKELLKNVKFEFVDSIEQVLELALVPVKGKKVAKPKPAGKKKATASTNGASTKSKVRA